MDAIDVSKDTCGVACLYCGSAELRVKYRSLSDLTFYATDQEFDLLECADCRSLRLSRIPPIGELKGFYRSYYTNNKRQFPTSHRRSFFSKLKNLFTRHLNAIIIRSLPAGRRKSLSARRTMFRVVFRNRYQNLERSFRYLRSSERNILDVGAGDGSFLDLVSGMDRCVFATEFDDANISILNTKGIAVVSIDDIDRCVLPEMDLITMSHVVEHFTDPKTELLRAFKLLADGGRLYISVPNVEAFCHKIYLKDWRGLEVPRHISVPSKLGLLSLLEECGFSKFEFHPSSANTSRMSAVSRQITIQRPISNFKISFFDRFVGLRAFFARKFLGEFNYEFITLSVYK